MSAYIGASPASRRFQSLKELTGSPTCRQKACWESPLWACSSTQACHCEAGWREWRRFDMGTDAPSVNDGISVGGQAISKNDAPGWPLTVELLEDVTGTAALGAGAASEAASALDVATEYLDAAVAITVGAGEPGHVAHQGGLAGARRAHQGNHFAGRYGKADLAKNRVLAEGLADPIDQDAVNRHDASPLGNGISVAVSG